MIFSSFEFILGFLPVTLAVFFLLPSHWRVSRKLWLTLASVFFYAYWKVEYVVLLGASIGFNYLVAEALNRRRGQRGSRTLLFLGVAGNLLLLGYFKYANFALTVVGQVTGHKFDTLNIILPLAISFFTFTQISYIVDVYHDARVHYRFLDYALFVVLFPHLIAGPIVRHWEVIPQFAERDLRPTRTDWAVGLALFIFGLGKKVLIADTLGQHVDPIFNAAATGGTLDWAHAWLGTLGFGAQIYFDFSGYSDMAIGLARMFSIRFPHNFDSPYRATSIIEFWRRWHVTLSRFLREYVYYPLGGNRCSKRRQSFNVMATMLLSGLWHGAGWTFVFWGGLHGAYVLIAHYWRGFTQKMGWREGSRVWSFLGVAITFVAVTVAWAYFRAPDMSTANRMVASMAGADGLTISDDFTSSDKQPGLFLQRVGFKFVPVTVAIESHREALWAVGLALLICWAFPNTQQLLARYEPVLESIIRPSYLRIRLGWVTGLCLGVMLFFVFRSHYGTAASPFIYFNF